MKFTPEYLTQNSTFGKFADMKSPLTDIASRAAARSGQPEPAPMHENPALAEAMQQLQEAADRNERDGKRQLTSYRRGLYAGYADAYRHVISVLAQLKV